MQRYLVTAATLMLSTAVLAGDRVTVPAGSFQMGCSVSDTACEDDEGPPGGVAVEVAAFAIDRHEVTVADYRECMAADACGRPKDFNRNKYCNLDAPEREQHPINCVDWDQAVAYCEWKGARLPSEAEWEKAARAGSTKAYSWGNEVSCDNAVLDPVSPAPSDREPDGCYRDTTWPVASRPANALGLFDMQGNAGEWVANWYAGDGIARYAAGDLQGPDSGRRRVVRGGSWDENRPNLRSSYRNVKDPVSGRSVYGSIGFRCVADTG